MHIMTKNGWRPLTPKKLEQNPVAPELYSGPIPSFDCLSFVKALEKESKEWNDRRKALMGE